jgi:hypothetical protein
VGLVVVCVLDVAELVVVALVVVVEVAVVVVGVPEVLDVGLVLELVVEVIWLGAGRVNANQIPPIPWPLVSPGLLSPL